MRRALALAPLLLVAGCFSPKISDGDFTCAMSHLCPHGFSCIDGVCRSSSFVPGPGDMSGGGDDMGGDDAMTPQLTFAGNGMLGIVDLTGQSGTLLCNTETGTIHFMGGNTIVPANSPGFVHTTQPNGPPVAIWNFAQLVIPPTVTVTPESSSASVPVFVASMSMRIEGAIDWRGFGGFGGQAGAPGSARGTTSNIGGGDGASVAGGGGGGGGYEQVGNMGGGPMPGAGGASYGTADLAPVYFGAGGGGGGGTMAGRGGAGGGALVLLGHSITIGSKIDVSGNDGLAATGSTLGGGGGGGSGGSILVGGDEVTLQAGHQLVAAGGKGQAGVDGPDGDGGGIVAGGKGGDGSPGRIRISAGTVTGAPNTQPAVMPDSMIVTAFPR